MPVCLEASSSNVTEKSVSVPTAVPSEQQTYVTSAPVFEADHWRKIAYSEIAAGRHAGVIRNAVKRLLKMLPTQFQNPDELLSDVYDWAVEAANRYDGRASFVTFLVWHLRMKSFNYRKSLYKERRRRNEIQLDNECQQLEVVALDGRDFFEELRFEDFKKRLSPEASFVLHLLLEHAHEIAALSPRSRPRANLIAQYLEISRSALQNAIGEIQSLYQECI